MASRKTGGLIPVRQIPLFAMIGLLVITALALRSRAENAAGCCRRWAV